MNFLKRLINSKYIVYVLEFIPPVVLSILFSEFLVNKYDSSKHYFIDDSYIIRNSFVFLFFFILLLEWFRRHKVKDARPSYEKYFYLAVMLLIFVLGVFYVNQLDL